MRGQRHAPAAPNPRERPGTHCTGGWVGLRVGLDWCGKSRPTEIRSPDQMNCVNIRNCSHLFQNASDIKLGKYRLEINIWYHSSWTFWPLKIAKIGCTETSLRNYHSTLRNVPTQCRSRLFLGWSLKSRIRYHSFQFLWTENQTTKTPRFIHISVTFDFKTKAQRYIQRRTNPGRPDGSAQDLWFFKMELALYDPSGA